MLSHTHKYRSCESPLRAHKHTRTHTHTHIENARPKCICSNSFQSQHGSARSTPKTPTFLDYHARACARTDQRSSWAGLGARRSTHQQCLLFSRWHNLWDTASGAASASTGALYCTQYTRRRIIYLLVPRLLVRARVSDTHTGVVVGALSSCECRTHTHTLIYGCRCQEPQRGVAPLPKLHRHLRERRIVRPGSSAAFAGSRATGAPRRTV